ncbi:hypothetical protein MESS4_330022 [Mesorhizobium sp. STM 4661]|nr:hypothetical protein MESS4_330022 [Mesorhizobium sp. STM 4661]
MMMRIMHCADRSLSPQKPHTMRPSVLARRGLCPIGTKRACRNRRCRMRPTLPMPLMCEPSNYLNEKRKSSGLTEATKNEAPWIGADPQDFATVRYAAGGSYARPRTRLWEPNRGRGGVGAGSCR